MPAKSRAGRGTAAGTSAGTGIGSRSSMGQMGISSILAYAPDSVTTFGVGLTGTGSYNERINGFFAFETNIAVDTLASRLRECACIDFLVIPGKYFFLGRVRKSPHYFVQANGETASHALFSTKDAVTLWTVYLQILLSQSRLIAVDRKKIMGVLLSLQTNLHSATTYSSPKN